MAKTSRIKNLAIALDVYLQSLLIAPHPEPVPTIFPDEDGIRNATKDLGGLGEAVMSLYYHVGHFENGSVVSRPEIPLGAIGTIYIDSMRQIHNYRGDRAWMSLDGSRAIFSELIKEDLARVTSEGYQGLPAQLKSIVDKGRRIAEA